MSDAIKQKQFTNTIPSNIFVSLLFLLQLLEFHEKISLPCFQELPKFIPTHFVRYVKVFIPYIAFIQNIKCILSSNHIRLRLIIELLVIVKLVELILRLILYLNLLLIIVVLWGVNLLIFKLIIIGIMVALLIIGLTIGLIMSRLVVGYFRCV